MKEFFVTMQSLLPNLSRSERYIKSQDYDLIR